MTVADAGQYLGAVFRPLLGIHSSQALYAEALHLQAKSRLSWDDSLIVSAAIQANCDFLYTEDLQHGQRFGKLRAPISFSEMALLVACRGEFVTQQMQQSCFGRYRLTV
jgi:hypothetical protein